MGSNEMQKKNTFRTVMLGFLIIAFFVGIVFAYYNMVYEEKRSNIIKDGKMAARSSAWQFDRYLSTNMDLIKLTAYTLDEMIEEKHSDDDIQYYLVRQSTAIKNAVQENSTGLYGYINGRFFSGTNWEPPADYVATDRPWYTKAMEDKGRITILEPYVDVQSGNTMLALGKTLCDGISVISVDISLDQMQKLTEEAVSDGGADYEMILTGNGTVVTHSDPGEVGKIYSTENGTLGAEIYSRLCTEEEFYYELDHDWKHYVVYDARFEGDWHCVSVHDATNEFASLRQIFAITILVVSVMAVILVTMMVVSNKRAVIAGRVIEAEAEKKEQSASEREAAADRAPGHPRDVKDDEDDVQKKLEPLKGFSEIDTGQGIRNSGSLMAYLSLLKNFYASLDGNTQKLSVKLQRGDIAGYTALMHSIKSSARIIGAGNLAGSAQAMEDASRKGDMDYIMLHHEDFLKLYKSFEKPFSAVFR